MDSVDVIQLLRQGKTLEEVGRLMGGKSRQRVHQMVSRLPEYQELRRQQKEERERLAREIARMAGSHSVAEMAEELGISQSYVRFLAGEHRIRIPRVRKSIAGQVFPETHWEILEDLGYKLKGKDEYVPTMIPGASTFYVLARCLKCGKECRISQFNLSRGRTKCCQSCAAKAREERRARLKTGAD